MGEQVQTTDEFGTAALMSYLRRRFGRWSVRYPEVRARRRLGVVYLTPQEYAEAETEFDAQYGGPEYGARATIAKAKGGTS